MVSQAPRNQNKIGIHSLFMMNRKLICEKNVKSYETFLWFNIHDMSDSSQSMNNLTLINAKQKKYV